MHTAQTRTADRRSANALACAAGLVFLGLGACGAQDDDAAIDALAQVYLDASTPANSDAGVAPVDAGPPPDFTATVSSVTGVGCPAGSYRAEVGAGGKITLAYDAFEVSVGQGTSESIKDCQISIALVAKSGAQFAVTHYSHFGTAVLGEGVTGKQASSYYFPAARVTGRLRNSILIGPLRGPVTSDPILPTDVAWTPCALQQQLRITNRLELKGKGETALGTLSFASGDQAGAGASISLATRACTLPPPPAAP